VEGETISTLLELGLRRMDQTVLESTLLDGHTCRSWSARPAMGTVVSVVALHPSRALAEDAIFGAFEEMERLIAIFDRHDAATPVAQLNRAGTLDDAPPELTEVLEAAQRYHHLTCGAFDVTVKPLVDLLRATRGEPTRAERAEAEALVGASFLRMDGRRLAFDRAGMGVTLDGIAKGYVIDRIAATLAARGIRHFLINAGGDIRAKGGKHDGQPWRIGVRDPDDPERFTEVVSIRDGAVATSGNYEKPFAHLVDAGSGRPACQSSSASVSAPEAMEADALATALFVLGPAAGLRLANWLPGCECSIVDEAGCVARSPRWAGHPAWVGEA
jgi:thiamine biosynthesis lipoprotein